MSRLRLSRRSFLRGAAGVALALPTLDVMLNGNGDAYASGAPLVKRFGVWFWGGGVRLDRWVPSTTGAAWQLSPALVGLGGVKDYVNVVTNHRVVAAGPRGHHGGEAGMLSGVEFIPLDHPNSNYSSKFGAPSIDQLLAAELHPNKPVAAVGVSRRVIGGEGPTLNFISHRGPDQPIAPEYNPAAFFTTMFGSFNDIGTVDPRANLRASVLDAVGDDARALKQKLGTNDKARLDAHLTAVSELRTRILAQPPQYVGACQPHDAVTLTNTEANGVEPMQETSDIFSELLVLAFACDLTRAFSFMYSGSVGFNTSPDIGITTGHHDLTHDPSQTAQDQVHASTVQTISRYASLLQKLKDTPEGAGNLLDQSLIFATSDLAEGLTHSNDDYPILLGGRAGGAMTFPGVHYRGPTGALANTSDVLVTILRAMGSSRTSIGVGTEASSQVVSAVLA